MFHTRSTESKTKNSAFLFFCLTKRITTQWSWSFLLLMIIMLISVRIRVQQNKESDHYKRKEASSEMANTSTEHFTSPPPPPPLVCNVEKVDRIKYLVLVVAHEDWIPLFHPKKTRDERETEREISRQRNETKTNFEELSLKYICKEHAFHLQLSAQRNIIYMKWKERRSSMKQSRTGLVRGPKYFLCRYVHITNRQSSGGDGGSR